MRRRTPFRCLPNLGTNAYPYANAAPDQGGDALAACAVLRAKHETSQDRRVPRAPERLGYRGGASEPTRPSGSPRHPRRRRAGRSRQEPREAARRTRSPRVGLRHVRQGRNRRRKRVRSCIQELVADRGRIARRAHAGVQVLTTHPLLDGDIAAVDYCFGGRQVLELPRTGVDLAGAISVHASLETATPASQGDVRPRADRVRPARDGGRDRGRRPPRPHAPNPTAPST
jgi:Dienelactone hydrolase family